MTTRRTMGAACIGSFATMIGCLLIGFLWQSWMCPVALLFALPFGGCAAWLDATPKKAR